MNRRDFLKTAATVAALAPLANLTGKLEAAESKDGAAGPKVTRRRYRNTNMTLPLLGFDLTVFLRQTHQAETEERQSHVRVPIASTGDFRTGCPVL